MTTSANTSCDLQDIEVDLLLEGVYRVYGFDFRQYSRASIKRRLLELAFGSYGFGIYQSAGP